MKNLNTEIELPEPKVEDHQVTRWENTVKNFVQLLHQIVINWKDGHESKFKPEFFSKYGPNGTSGDYVGFFRKPELKKWKKDFLIPMHDMSEIEANDDALFSWLNGKPGITKYQESVMHFCCPRSLLLWVDHSQQCSQRPRWPAKAGQNDFSARDDSLRPVL